MNSAGAIQASTTVCDGNPVSGPVTVRGGLSFQDKEPCSDRAVAAAVVDRSGVYLALRFRTLASPPVTPESGLGASSSRPSSYR